MSNILSIVFQTVITTNDLCRLRWWWPFSFLNKLLFLLLNFIQTWGLQTRSSIYVLYKLIFSVQHVNTDILQSLQDLVVLHQILVFILILKYRDCVYTAWIFCHFIFYSNMTTALYIYKVLKTSYKNMHVCTVI